MIDTKNNTMHWSPIVFEIHERKKSLGVPKVSGGVDYYHPDDREYVKNCVENAIKKKKYFHFKKRIITDKGNERIVESFGRPELNEQGEITSIIGTFEDVTEKVREEKELDNYRKNLENIVQEQTKDILSAKEEAERANHMKTQFLANISHELRTPMHAILAFSRQGIEYIDEWNKNEKIENLSRIQISANRLANIINDLLDISKLEAGRVEYSLQNTNIENIIIDVINELQPIADEKGIYVKITKNKEAVVECDKDKIRQVILNLLSNAIKFNDEKKPILVKLDIKTNSLLASFTDEGKGIPKHELEEIFDKFVQSSKTRAGTSGTGLGLAICKEIIENGHNGKIWAENNKKSGATIYFSIPLKQKGKSNG